MKSLYKSVILDTFQQKFVIKSYILLGLVNSSVKFQSKICTHCWTINTSWRDIVFFRLAL